MKKIILAITCFLTIGLSSTAQEANVQQTTPEQKREAHTPEIIAQKQVDALNDALTLSEEQKTKAHGISLVIEKKRDEIKAKYKEKAMDSEKYSDEIAALRAEYKTNVMSILTPEQLEKFKASYKEVGK